MAPSLRTLLSTSILFISALAAPTKRQILPLNQVNGLVIPVTTLNAVGLGLGTQNYTCSRAGATPQPAGAYARLYSAQTQLNIRSALISSASATYLRAYEAANCQAGDLSCADDVNAGPSGLDLAVLGEHYFTAGTPTFNLHGNGILFAEDVGTTPAPSSAYDGEDGEGAVAWLYLPADGTERTTGESLVVYRVETAGGVPETCTRAGNVYTPYATQYWFYA